jgi:hypothetical protein
VRLVTRNKKEKQMIFKTSFATGEVKAYIPDWLFST